MRTKYYSIAIRKRTDCGDRFYKHKNFMFNEIKVKDSKKYWIADPFLFEKDNIVYIFYELFDIGVGCGRIAYSILKDDGTISSPKIIIRGKHKSFPFIFCVNDEIFILPESSEDRNIVLYRAKKFPEIWELYSVLIDDVFAVDNIILSNDGHNYLLSSEQYRFPEPGKVISCWVKNRVYKFEVSEKISIVNCGIVNEGDCGIRNAGMSFNEDNRLIRPGQNCEDGIYGKGLCLFEIDSIFPYSEKLIYQILPQQLSRHINFSSNNLEICGVHTYNSSEHYEIIDFSYYDETSFYVEIERRLRGAKRKLIKSFNNLVRLGKNCYEKFMKKFLHDNEEIYQALISKYAPWVFISYIADSFYHRDDNVYLDSHQNKREVLAMAESFNKLGYNAYFMLYNSDKPLPDIDCRLIFGHEPNVQRAKEKYCGAKMVYYGVSTYFDYRNNKIKQMTDEFNHLYSADIPYRRLVSPHDAIRDADSILLIGSNKTVNTYPDEYKGKITRIHQSTQLCKYLRNVEAHGTKDFLYMASYGNILKGIQAIIEYFAAHLEYRVHWVGPVEEDVRNAIKDKLTPNIHLYGYQNISSNTVLGLMERCDFILYPSGVEGVPGSVLNAMKSGLIPLVTPWASFDGAEEYGFVMKETNAEGVESAINWAMSLSIDEINRRKRSCQQFVLENYNLEIFKAEFFKYMSKRLK